MYRLHKAELAVKLIGLGVFSAALQHTEAGYHYSGDTAFDAATFSQRGDEYALTLIKLKAELKASA